MEQVVIWYLTDNESGNELAAAIKDLGLKTHIISDDDFNEMICNKDELGYRYYRNFGHFVDLLAGSIRQLDNKVEGLIKRIEAIEKQ